MRTFHLSILASDKDFFVGEAISLIIPITDGQYGIQAMHRNVIAAIIPGKLEYTLPDGTKQVAAVSNGMVKVENNDVLILVETAERPEEIDANRAKREIEMAKEELLQKQSLRDYRNATAQIARAINRLRVKGNHDIL